MTYSEDGEELGTLLGTADGFGLGPELREEDGTREGVALGTAVGHVLVSSSVLNLVSSTERCLVRDCVWQLGSGWVRNLDIHSGRSSVRHWGRARG